MRRLMLASLAILLLFLPFQAGVEAAAPACCPCMGAPACPPRCPAPAPSPSMACATVTLAMAIPGEVQAAAQRDEEASPAPISIIAEASAADRRQARLDAHASADPPDRGDGQALLRVFRI